MTDRLLEGNGHGINFFRNRYVWMITLEVIYVEVFEKNRKAEKKHAKRIKRRYKRYWIGYLVAGILIVLIGVHSYDVFMEIMPMEEPFSIIMLMFGYNILYLIGVLFAIIVAAGGGRDQLLARLNEQVSIEQDSIRISYKPKMREIEKGDYAEYEIRPEKVRSLEYNERYGCLEILADCTYKVWENRERRPERMSETSYENKKLMIYDCFDNMEGLKKAIQRVTAKEVVIKRGGIRF